MARETRAERIWSWLSDLAVIGIALDFWVIGIPLARVIYLYNKMNDLGNLRLFFEAI